MGSSTPLVGRVRERQLLEEAAARARTGDPSALIVHGEPGVGKTRLVTEIADHLGQQGFQVLWGRCVRFAAEASSYLPIGQAMGARLELTGPASDGGPVLHRVGDAFTELMGSGPVALVVDDLQWADLSSLDVLTYLVAGFAPGQPLLIVGSYRDTELGTGHPLHTWLADLRRMPNVEFMRLGRLDRHDSEVLVDSLLGPGRHAALATQAFDRSDGNPYLIELLVRDLEPTAEELPAALPGDLREALLAAWHRLSAPTRELMQVLAVGGRPVDVAVLAQVAGAVGVDADKVAAGVGEAADAGLVVVDGDGSVWFHHPLVPEVLVSTLLPPDAVRLHTEYVTVWLATDGVPEHVRAAHLALHHDAAGDVSKSLIWSLRAAAEAERVRGYAEESHHLVRACDLWTRAAEVARGEAGDHVDLLLRTTRAAHRAGDFNSAMGLGERAYELAADHADPLMRCRVLTELNTLRRGMDWPVDALGESVRTSSAYPNSPEHARALADLALYEQRHSDPDAIPHAAEALDAAERCGSDEALAHALFVAARTRGGRPEALELAEEALRLSRRCGNTWLMASSAIATGNCLQGAGRNVEAGPFEFEVSQEIARAGAPHHAAWLAVAAAGLLMEFGEWHTCRSLLRDALSARVDTGTAWVARLWSAELAARCGQLSTAQQHLDRAEELAAALGPERDPSAVEFVDVAVDVSAAAGRYRHVVAILLSQIEAMARWDPVWADDLMARAAAATADWIERDPDDREEAIARLDELEAARATASPALWHPPPGDRSLVAHQSLYDAHRCRATGDHGGDIDTWEHAVRACDAAALPWQAAQARHRLAAALLAQRRNRGEAARLLRQGLRIATNLGAEPIRADIAALSLQAHISLAEPDSVEVPPVDLPLLDGLTKREHEVLMHLVAGRTYAEIAVELFISEKTVSVHVSNLLRKTGTANRIELAALARRRRTGQ